MSGKGDSMKNRGLWGALIASLLLSTSAWAQQVACDEGGPRITGTDADVVLIAIDGEVVQITDRPEVEGAIDIETFCAQHEGLVAFVLPAPKPVGDSVPAGPPLPEPQSSSSPYATPGGFARRTHTSFRKPAAPAQEDPRMPAPVAAPEDGEEGGTPAGEPAPSPAAESPDGRPGVQPAGLDPAAAAGCDATGAGAAAPWALLLLALPGLRRRNRRGA